MDTGRKLLERARAKLKDCLEAFGPCDHGVGICNCDLSRCIAAIDHHLKGKPEPAAQVPLSHIQLNDIASQARVDFCLGKAPSFDLAFARAIEAAHGIATLKETGR